MVCVFLNTLKIFLSFYRVTVCTYVCAHVLLASYNNLSACSFISTGQLPIFTVHIDFVVGIQLKHACCLGHISIKCSFSSSVDMNAYLPNVLWVRLFTINVEMLGAFDNAE